MDHALPQPSAGVLDGNYSLHLWHNLAKTVSKGCPAVRGIHWRRQAPGLTRRGEGVDCGRVPVWRGEGQRRCPQARIESFPDIWVAQRPCQALQRSGNDRSGWPSNIMVWHSCQRLLRLMMYPSLLAILADRAAFVSLGRSKPRASIEV